LLSTFAFKFNLRRYTKEKEQLKEWKERKKLASEG
jgi:hypothetical protein